MARKPVDPLPLPSLPMPRKYARALPTLGTIRAAVRATRSRRSAVKRPEPRWHLVPVDSDRFDRVIAEDLFLVPLCPCDVCAPLVRGCIFYRYPAEVAAGRVILMDVDGNRARFARGLFILNQHLGFSRTWKAPYGCKVDLDYAPKLDMAALAHMRAGHLLVRPQTAVPTRASYIVARLPIPDILGPVFGLPETTPGLVRRPTMDDPSVALHADDLVRLRLRRRKSQQAIAREKKRRKALAALGKPATSLNQLQSRRYRHAQYIRWERARKLGLVTGDFDAQQLSEVDKRNPRKAGDHGK